MDGKTRPGKPNPEDAYRAALTPCSWFGLGCVAFIVAALFSVPGYYNDIYGPFPLSVDRLVVAETVKALGSERYFQVDFESIEDTGWYQFLQTHETFTRAEVSTPPQSFYLVGKVGSIYLAVESTKPDTGARQIEGMLHDLPPKLRAMLEQAGWTEPMPRFFLQERQTSSAWAFELAAGGLLALWLIASFAKAVAALAILRQAMAHHGVVESEYGPN